MGPSEGAVESVRQQQHVRVHGFEQAVRRQLGVEGAEEQEFHGRVQAAGAANLGPRQFGSEEVSNHGQRWRRILTTRV